MKYEKGQSGNPGGRPKGAANKVTAKLRETISGFLDEQFESIKTDFANLKPAERVKLYIELLQYGVPKLQAVQIETEFDRLTDEQLQEIVDELTSKIKSASNE
jgi:hypothetical protein